MSLDALPPDTRDAAVEFLLAIADDDFLFGDRLMVRWLSQGPTLEEDTAMTSIAQDEMGHARLWYEVVADHRDETVDALAFARSATSRRNSVLVERSLGDFADTIVRSHLYHEAERRLLDTISGGSVEGLSSRADVALNEESYHREHAELWLERLTASGEGRSRIEAAFETNTRLARDLFAFDPALEDTLSDHGIIDGSFATLREDWTERISGVVAGLDVGISGEEVRVWLDAEPEYVGRAGEHTEDLDGVVRSHRTAHAGTP